MAKILTFEQFLFEQENSDKIYTTPGDPYQYKVSNGVWMTKGPKISDWKSLADNKKATDKLDSRYPEARKGITKQQDKSTGSTDIKTTGIKTSDAGISDIIKDYKGEVLVCTHAGSWDGPGGSRAENCLKNIELNIKAGTPMIEIDIQVTSDGVPVLFHDGILDKKTNGSGKVQNMSWSEVSRISYKSDTSQTICKLEDVINLIKKYRSKSILQLDKCDASELAVINKLGLVKGIENQILAKGTSYNPPGIVGTMGIKWMSILPSSNVGMMNTKGAVDLVVSKVTPGFFEYQFSDSDTQIVNGYMSQALKAKGVLPMVVAVGGTQKTNGASYRGDSGSAWKKIINNIKPSLIMTNRPSQLATLLK